MLPPDAEQWVTRMLKRGDGDDDASPEDAPAPQSPPDDSTDLPENDAPPATRS